MQGQYKTPGGKLVAVDFDVEDGELRNVVVHGDFFLYPDDAFGVIAGALEGAPADAGEAAFAERVRSAIDQRAELIGSSPEAIAIAVTRGLLAGEEVAS